MWEAKLPHGVEAASYIESIESEVAALFSRRRRRLLPALLAPPVLASPAASLTSSSLIMYSFTLRFGAPNPPVGGASPWTPTNALQRTENRGFVVQKCA